MSEELSPKRFRSNVEDDAEIVAKSVVFSAPGAVVKPEDERYVDSFSLENTICSCSSSSM